MNSCIHFLRGEFFPVKMALEVMDDPLHDDDGTVNDQAKVNGTKAHQVG